MLEPFEPSRESPWDFGAAAHLLRRTGFGATAAEVEEALRLGPAAAVLRVVEGRGEAEGVDPAEAELESIFPTLLGVGSVEAFRGWILARMLRCRHQLREKMALFWHDHFATSVAKVREPVWMARQYRLFLSHGLGPFGALLGQVARDPAMLRWLDNETNRKGHPNENFARELFELFTLGVGNYTERDIQEAARAFTGWGIVKERFRFTGSLHDDGEKTVLGRKGRFGGEEILAAALAEPACGRFLAGKLLRAFVSPEPDPAVAGALGERLRATGYDISGALRLLLGSRHFFDPAHRRALVMSPVDFAVGTIRSLGLRGDAAALQPLLGEMGQAILAPPNVKGWPGGRAWINTATWLTRLQAARQVTEPLEGEAGIEDLSRALLGGPPPEEAREALLASGLRGRELARALLALPEAHLL